MSYAQENATAYVYHPLSEFGTDTLRFLKTNFERKSDYFKGKPLGEVLKYYRRDLPVNVFLLMEQVHTSTLMEKAILKASRWLIMILYITIMH